VNASTVLLAVYKRSSSRPYFFYEQFSSRLHDTFAKTSICDTFDSLLTFHQESYGIRV